MRDRTGFVWTENETTLALYLYYQIEAGEVKNRSKAIKDLAAFLNRTHGSVEMKIGNLQYCDNKNTKGLKNGGKKDEIVFNKYLYHPDLLEKKSRALLNLDPNSSYLISYLFDDDTNINDLDLNSDFTGTDKEAVVKQRKEQSTFRKRILANYDHHCCLSGISTTQLLLASHIVPWSKDESKRLDPRNGLLLNAILDRAFDKGIVSVRAEDFTLLVSDKLKDQKTIDYLSQFKGEKISLPKNSQIWPDKLNLQYHNDVIFNKYDVSSIKDFPTFDNYLTTCSKT